MFIRIISDCRDDNARGRVETRISALLHCAPGFTGVGSDLEAAGNLVDMLAAGLGRHGIVIVNVAPRNEQRDNGSPFGVFIWRNTTVLTTIDGVTLSLVSKLGMCEQLHAIDFEATLGIIAKRFGLTDDECDAIRDSQFRGLEFQPFCAALLADRMRLPESPRLITAVPELPEHTVWWIDNFGNVKLTTLGSEHALSPGTPVELRMNGIPHTLSFCPRLKHVPRGKAALIHGSSGVGDKRFFEIVIKNGRAAEHFGIASGDALLLTLPSLQRVATNT